MVNTDIQHYKNQLKKMNVKNNLIRFKFMDDSGDNTNVMNLNLESIEALQDFLKESKKIIQKLRKNN